MKCLNVENRGTYHKQTNNVTLLMKLWTIMIFCLIAGNVSAQKPADGIVKKMKADTALFHPTCNGIPLDSATLSRYHWFWDFGNGDYSFEPIPHRAYSAQMQRISSVKLTVSNIKDDEPESPAPTVEIGCPTGRCGGSGIQTNAEALPHEIWYCDLDTSISYGGVAQSLVSNYEVSIEQSCPPKPGHKIRYQVRVKRNSTVNDLDTHYVQIAFATSNYLQYSQSSSPIHWPLTSSLDSSRHDSSFLYYLELPPDCEKVTGLEFEVANLARRGDLVNMDFSVKIIDYSPPVTPSDPSEKDPASFPTYSQIAAGNVLDTTLTTSSTIQNAWDPNFIRSYPNWEIEPGGRILYHIRFQNDGNAATKNAVLHVDLPEELDSWSIISHRFDSTVGLLPITGSDIPGVPLNDYSSYQLYFNDSTPVYFPPMELDSGESVELFIEGVVKNEPNLCNGELVAKMKVEFDNASNYVVPPDQTTSIVCPSNCPEKDPFWTSWIFWLLILVIIILLILVVIYAIRSRNGSNQVTFQPVPQP